MWDRIQIYCWLNELVFVNAKINATKKVSNVKIAMTSLPIEMHTDFSVAYGTLIPAHIWQRQQSNVTLQTASGFSISQLQNALHIIVYWMTH